MYLYLSADKAIKTDDIIGIFDLDTTTVAKSTAAITNDYLSKASKAGEIEDYSTDLPKSFVVCEKDGKQKVYITQVSSATILKRIEEKYGRM